jgi:DNA-binding CsgD family transcriptional regulator
MAAKAHKPTAESRAQVEALSGYGIRHDEIALYLEIDPKTLRKHYRDQLDKGQIKANVGVARALHKNATEGNVTA